MLDKSKFDETIDTFTLDKVCSASPDQDAKARGESKQFTLRIKFQGATIRTLAQSCLGQGVVVKWQNGRARKDYTKLADKSVIPIDWAAPATAPQLDPKTAMLMEAKAAGVDITDKAALMEWIESQF